MVTDYFLASDFIVFSLKPLSPILPSHAAELTSAPSINTVFAS